MMQQKQNKEGKFMSEKDKVIDIALAEVDYVEKATNSNLDSKTGNAGSGNYTKYARDLDNIKDFYNGKKNGYAWCDIFVDWCFVKAYGVEEAKRLLCQPSKSTGAGCGFSMNFYKAHNQFYSSPKAGDQIFFTDGTNIYHTGLVCKVDNSKVYTVEGNTSNVNYVDGNGGKVCKKSYPLGASYIAGYGRPKYDTATIDIPIEKEEDKKDNKIIDTVKVTANAGLNCRKKATTNSDIIKAYTKGTSLKIYEIDGNWGRTNEGWVCLVYTDYKKSDTSSSSSNSNKASKYSTGRYEVNTDVLTVRRTPEVKENNWLRYSQLTTNAQKQVKQKCGYEANGLVKGVQCDVSQVSGNWGKIPSRLDLLGLLQENIIKKFKKERKKIWLLIK